MIHNYKKYYFLFFFILFSYFCKSLPISEAEKEEISKKYIGTYFQKSKILNTNTFFEKASSQYDFVVVKADNSSSVEVKEISITFHAYTGKFLQDVYRLFPNQSLPKYTIFERVKFGKGKLNSDSDMEVEFTNFTTRSSQGDDLIQTIDKFISGKKEAQQLFHEKTSFTITPDEGLWKSEEVEFKDGKESLRWKNYPGGTPIRNYPYSEFSPNKNTLEYSRIYSFEDYSFKKIFADIPSGSKLYTNKEFAIYYFPGDKVDPNDTNVIYYKKKNRPLTLFKMELPIIIYKKKESIPK